MNKLKDRFIKRKKQKPFLIRISPYIFIAAVILIWELVVVIFKLPRVVLPSFFKVITVTVQNFSENIAWHLWVTLRTAAIGMLVSIPLGILFASVFSQFKVLTHGMTPIILVLVVTPLISLVPLFMMWLGFDYQPRWIVVTVATVPTITLNTLYGFLGVPSKYDELMKGYGAGKWTRFFKVALPYALPQVFTGIELGIILSTIATTSVEMVAGNPGLGYRITYFARLLQSELVFGTIFCISLIGISFVAIKEYAYKRIVHWQ